MSAPLPLGATIGIIGGGQLGRMLAMAAARLGYQTIVLEPQADCPAAQVANRQIVAAYDDPAALDRFDGGPGTDGVRAAPTGHDLADRKTEPRGFGGAQV